MPKTILDIKTIRELHRSGKFIEAKKEYLKILRNNPRDIEVLYSLGILCTQQNDFDGAIDYLKKALQIQPDNPILNSAFANILKLKGSFAEAIAILNATIEKNPDYIPAYNNLGTVYFADGNLEAAIHQYQLAIQKKPDYVDAYYNLGLALTKQKNFLAAIKIYQKILTIAPDHFAACFHLACNFMQVQQYTEAINLFLTIEKNQPNHHETQSNLATTYLKIGNLSAAKEHYLKALTLVENDVQSLFNLGVISMQQGLIDNAIQYYQEGVKLDPDNFALHNNLGVAFLAKQHAGFALKHFKEALRLQPHNKALAHTIEVLTQHKFLLASPAEYVKSLFDSYADHYDAHLVQALDYKIPELFLQAMNQVTTLKHVNILDLGCGTGLCGVAFKAYAKSLIGVDLSPQMLHFAAEKNIYDQLIESELLNFLTQNTEQYDLILAGDVLVYLGDLQELFQKIPHALRTGGLFIFNTEIALNEDFKMNQSGRFSHHKNYIEQLAERNHLTIVYYEEVITRMQNNEPVWGHLFVMRHSSH